MAFIYLPVFQHLQRFLDARHGQAACPIELKEPLDLPSASVTASFSRTALERRFPENLLLGGFRVQPHHVNQLFRQMLGQNCS